MSHPLPASAHPAADEPVARPAMTRMESKAEAISRAAMETIQQEVARREAKTAQLRAARLAKEASERAAVAAKPASPKRKATSAR